MSGGWSLGRRTGLAFALTATSFLVVVGGLSVGGYAWALTGELDEELEEQIAALRAADAARPPGDVPALERTLEASTAADLEEPLAFVVLGPDDAPIARLGPLHLLAALDGADAPGDEVDRRPGSIRRARWRTTDGFTVLTALDGSAWTARIGTIGGSVAAIVLVGALLSLVAGRAFGARVAAWLEEVSRVIDRRRDAETVDGPELRDAPDEVRAVAESLDESMRAAAAELERAGLLSSGLAHDLRAPVQSLLTSTQVALQGSAATGPAREVLTRHLTELRQLSHTIDNVVAWGAPQPAEAGGVPFDATEEISARLAAEEAAAAAAGVLIDVERRGDTRLVGDPDAYVLAVRNLVGNAVAWSSQGGQVLATVEGEADAVVVHVDDSGPGVPKDERSRIFEPFVRGAAAPGRRAGYGLGLAIARRVAERHGGTLEVADAPEGGARFTLRVPRGA